MSSTISKPLLLALCAGCALIGCSGAGHVSKTADEPRPPPEPDDGTAMPATSSEGGPMSAGSGTHQDGMATLPTSTRDAAPSVPAGGGSQEADAAVDATSVGPFEGEGEPWTKPAPRANCAAGDRTDGTISGVDGDFLCNLEIVGQLEAPSYIMMGWYDECAYVNGPDSTTVIHVAPDGTPTVTDALTIPGFRNSWESMKASSASGLLVGYEANAATLAVYDLKQDCTKPALGNSLTLSGTLLGASVGHAGNFSPDGTIYYASSTYTSEVFAVDLANPKQPTVITSDFERGAHDLFVAKNGTRGYFAGPDIATQLLENVGGVYVMDLSQVQARAPNARGTLIAELRWEDGFGTQYPILVSYRGQDYLIVNDELGAGNCDNPDKPQFARPTRVLNIGELDNPKLASYITTEAQDPMNCDAALKAAQEGADQDLTKSVFGFGTHYCNVDRLEDPRLLSCGNHSSGVRVYDIRNPWRPKEVAYFDTPELNAPGMQRIYAEKRELWVASQSSMFYVLKFPEGGVVDTILSN